MPQMTIFFDGRGFSDRKLKKLDKEVAKLKNQGIHPRLASLLVGEDPASKLYVSLKKKRAQEIGAEMDVYLFPENETLENILILMDTLNKDKLVHGVMVQLPLPGNLGKLKKEIIGAISPEKDVDGLGNDSPFVHPTAMAVMQIIDQAQKSLDKKLTSISVVGGDGMVGSSLITELKNSPFHLLEDTKNADIVVSATGSPGIIKKEAVKAGVVLIDVGSPKPDADPQVYSKADFVTPVPGGVGPVTITCLLENLIIASQSKI